MRRVRCLEDEILRRASCRRQEALRRLEGMRKVHRRRLELESRTACEGFDHPCQIMDGLELVCPGSAYNWDGLRGLDPNGPLLLCPICARDMEEHWSERWAEYRSSQGFGSSSPPALPKLRIFHNLKPYMTVGVIPPKNCLGIMSITAT